MLAETLRAASDSLGAPNLTVATRAQMTAITAYCNEQLFDHEATRRTSAKFVQCQLTGQKHAAHGPRAQVSRPAADVPRGGG
jgi:hypothetical protein